MREIIFRGKCNHNNKGWVQGLLVEGSLFEDPNYLSDYWIATGLEDEAYPVQTNTIGQYTGVDDVEGNKMFEGDIVESYVHFDKGFKKGLFVVEYDSNLAAFGLFYIEEEFFKPMNVAYKKVIGNIHDNPEMLK